jgi:CheY-like chemotaxis protein
MGKRFRILVVDDDPQDVELLRHALRACGEELCMDAVGDGTEALAYLRREAPYADRPLPHLVLLDLNMPRKDGRTFLAERRADPRLLAVPVVVLTTSCAQRDVRDCYALGANCFVTKPVDYDSYCKALRAVETYWTSVAALPEGVGS